MAFRVRFGGSVMDYEGIESLTEAQALADENAAFTEQDITIVDDDTGRVVATRDWHKGSGMHNGELNLEVDPIVFGASGYYGDWWCQNC